MNYHELEKTTVGKLRDMLKEQDPEIKGLSGMKKGELVDALAAKLGIEKPHKIVAGDDKGSLKREIRALKAEKAAALSKSDRSGLKGIRENLHRLRRRLKKASKNVA